jgi:hypothetical protein
LVVAVVGVVVVLIPVATESGEALARRVGTPEEHAELGSQLIWYALPLFLIVLALVVFDRVRAPANAPARSDRLPATSRSHVMTVLAVLAVVSALAAIVQVVRVGDSGARAAWEDVIHD